MLKRGAKVVLVFLIVTAGIIAFTPAGLTNVWNSSTAGEIDTTLKSAGDDVERWIADATSSNEAKIERRIHERINEIRAERGLSNLSWSGELHSVADSHSQDMANRSYYGHNTPSGVSPEERFQRAGVSCPYAGENLFRIEQMSASNEKQVVKMVVNGWMNSTQHRQNILQSDISSEGIGVGVGESESGEPVIYVTQNFCN